MAERKPESPDDFNITFIESPDAKERLAGFVDWLLKIDPNDSALIEPAKAKAKAKASKT